jgi:hypothetical protein
MIKIAPTIMKLNEKTPDWFEIPCSRCAMLLPETHSKWANLGSDDAETTSYE